LRGPQILGHVLQVDADARPRLKSSTHAIDEHVRGLQMRRRFGMTRLPPRQSCLRVGFLLRAPNLDERAR